VKDVVNEAVTLVYDGGEPIAREVAGRYCGEPDELFLGSARFVQAAVGDHRAGGHSPQHMGLVVVLRDGHDKPESFTVIEVFPG
jgi:hypothetical protein